MPRDAKLWQFGILPTFSQNDLVWLLVAVGVDEGQCAVQYIRRPTSGSGQKLS